MTNIRVAIFDDHPIVIDGVLRVLTQIDDMDCAGTGSTAAAAAEYALENRADVLVMDLGMTGDVCRTIMKLQRLTPDVQVLIFTASNELQDARRVLEAGARGYVVKGCSGAELADAIRALFRGEVYISQTVAARMIMASQKAMQNHREAEDLRLNMREQQILKLLLTGMTNREIAARLKISEKTVKHYMSLVMQKLNVRNRLEAVLAAQKLQSSLNQRPRTAGFLQ
ncbi:LuxR C-terminal-related transcriptional regulator [Falsigemmobacter faecalis]|nr:response regulator transcription factor [Falsigemmobacter faecalis]